MNTKKYKTVDEFLSDLSDEKGSQVKELREIILSADKEL